MPYQYRTIRLPEDGDLALKWDEIFDEYATRDWRLVSVTSAPSGETTSTYATFERELELHPIPLEPDEYDSLTAVLYDHANWRDWPELMSAAGRIDSAIVDDDPTDFGPAAEDFLDAIEVRLESRDAQDLAFVAWTFYELLMELKDDSAGSTRLAMFMAESGAALEDRANLLSRTTASD
jgi:hypothetical protein